MIAPTLVLVVTLHCLRAVAQRVIVADIYKPTTSPHNNITARADLFAARLTQKPDKSMYWINITIGTPGQPQSLQFDTGSRQSWVPATRSSLCSASLVNCGELGSFDKSASSTFDGTGQSTSVSYSDGTGASGDWFYDTVHIGGQAVTKQLTIMATTGSGVQEGVLGVGFPASYPTVNHNLADRGVIPSNKYSVWLNSLDAASGTILFGGLDLSKFVAPLKRIPVIGSGNQPTVELSRVTTVKGILTTVQTARGYSEPAILDTGTTLTVLPNLLATIIINAMGAQYYPSSATSGTSIIPCSQSINQLSINFHFGSALGLMINVDISQMVLQDLGELNGIEMCQFGIYASDGSYPTTLGDSFLRSAYVLYDLDANRIGLAQAIVSGGVVADVVEVPESGVLAGVVT